MEDKRDEEQEMGKTLKRVEGVEKKREEERRLYGEERNCNMRNGVEGRKTKRHIKEGYILKLMCHYSEGDNLSDMQK